MKKIVSIFLLFVLAISLSSCSKTKIGVDNFQYLYDVIDDWNKQATPGHEREDLFGYGEYLYNSYLILFPRETPSTLTDFYFEWMPLIDVDGYAAYFTCQLTDENYLLFVDGLNNVTFSSKEKETKLLFNDSNFETDAYIIQWLKPSEKWEVLEYILLDDENNTVIFVYTMGMLNVINDYSNYNIMPKDEFDEDIVGFSIYDDFENATYNIEFLDYLNS